MRNVEKSLRYGLAALLIAVSLSAGVWARMPVQRVEEGLSAAAQRVRPGRRGRIGKPDRGSAPKRLGRSERQAARAERRQNRDSMIVRALRAANLTAEQRRQVGEIRDRHDVRIRGFGRKLIDQRRRLVDALEEPTPNVTRARSILGELTTTIGEQVAARTDVELELFRLLTSEQRASVRAFRAAQFDKGGRAREGGLGRGNPADRGRQADPDSSEETDLPLGDSSVVDDPPAASTNPSTQQPTNTRPSANNPRVRPMLALELTLDQRRKLREMRRQQGPDLRALTARFRDARRALGDALLADTIDPNLVKRLGTEVGRLEAERAKTRFEVEVGLLSILTPDQIRRYRELRLERRNAGASGPAQGLDRP
jgi:Spy/CpxP family protein refolding chaperone